MTFVSASAQQQTVRVAGTVDGFDGHVLAVKSDKLGEVKVNLTSDVAVFGVAKATLADIKVGSYIGVGAMPQTALMAAGCEAWAAGWRSSTAR